MLPLELCLTHQLQLALQFFDVRNPVGFGNAGLGAELVEGGLGLLELLFQDTGGTVLLRGENVSDRSRLCER